MTTRRGPLRFPRLLSAAACAAVVLAGCGSQPFGPHSGNAPAAGSPRQRAVADAARIIASLPRPPGAVRTGPIVSLTQPGERPDTPDLASVTQWWRAPGRPRTVLAWIHAHLPSGFALDGTGTGNGQWTDVFALPAVPGVLTQRELVVLAVPDGGQTAIRADAQVVWLPARPASERIPQDAAVVTVTPYFGLYPSPRVERLDRAFTVTDPAKVARIAALIDGLARFPAGTFSCPADFGGQMRLTFATGPGGPVVARVAAEYDGCRDVSLNVGGRNMPALRDDPDSWPPVQQRILAIAGVSWPVQPGDPT